MSAIFRIAPDFAGRAHIVCESCGGETRYWSAEQAAKWKQSHAANCPGHQPRLGEGLA